MATLHIPAPTPPTAQQPGFTFVGRVLSPDTSLFKPAHLALSSPEPAWAWPPDLQALCRCCSVVSDFWRPHGLQHARISSFTISRSLLKLMSIELVMPFSMQRQAPYVSPFHLDFVSPPHPQTVSSWGGVLSVQTLLCPSTHRGPGRGSPHQSLVEVGRSCPVSRPSLAHPTRRARTDVPLV